jgi:hypothetical protein
MNLYDTIYNLLRDDHDLRYSDKKLIWRVWEKQRIAGAYIHMEDFIYEAECPETIRRIRQKIQETHKEVARVKSTKYESDNAYIYRKSMFDGGLF